MCMACIDNLNAMSIKDLRAKISAWEFLIVTEIEFSQTVCNVRDDTKSPAHCK